MRVFSQGLLAQRVAQVLVVAFLWSTTVWSVLPASAQVPTRSTQASQSVAVVPFQNLTTYHPDTFGDEAAAAIASELRDRLLLDVLPSTDVAAEMKSLGFKPPMSGSELDRLATELETNMIVTGEVRQAEVLVSGGQRYAQVQLAVLLYDRASSADVNGAFVTAKSPSSADMSSDDLIKKALQQAAFLATQEMKTRPTVTAMVLWARGNEIFTNTGTRGGITPGMKMVAIRDGQRIGVVTMTSADAVGSYGKVTEGTQLRTGDHLRAIFELPEARKQTLVTRARKASSGLTSVLVPAAILLGVAGLAGSNRRALEGAVAAGSMRTSNLANGAEQGMTGFVENTMPVPIPDPANPGQFLKTPDFVSFPVPYGATVVSWQPLGGTLKKRVAGYVFLRDNAPFDFALVQENLQNAVVDTGVPTGGTSTAFLGAQVQTFTLTVDPTTGYLTGSTSAVSVWDPTTITVNTDGTIQYSEDWPTFVNRVAPGGLVISNGGTSMYGAWIRTGPEAGHTYHYSIQPIVIQDLGSSGIANWNFASLFVTAPLTQRLTSFMGPVDSQFTKVSLDSKNGLSVDTYNPTGADEMVVQITRDPGFGQQVRFRSGNFAQATATSLDPNAHDVFDPAPASNVKMSIPISAINALPGSTGSFWVRIGARNRSDQFVPQPFPLPSTNNPDDPLNDQVGWVWWDVGQKQFSLTTKAVPSMKTERETFSSLRRSTRLPSRTRTGGRTLHK